MLLLALVRGLVPHRESVLDGRWSGGGQFVVFGYGSVPFGVVIVESAHAFASA